MHRYKRREIHLTRSEKYIFVKMLWEITVLEKKTSENNVSGNTVLENTISDKTLLENTVSEYTV